MHLATRPMRLLAAIAAVLALLPATLAVAQGTSGSFPGPINSKQLADYAARLELSTSQRLAVEAAHDAYRDQFRELRDGEIAAFLRDQGAVQGGIPKRDVVADMLERFEQIQTKIAVLDNGLFDQLVPMLSDEQQGMVPRLRLLRERTRYEPQVTQASFGRRISDLSELFRALDLEDDDFASADAMIAGYERRMTSIMRKQHKAIIRMTLDMMDELAIRGYVDISQEALLADPPLLQEVLKQIGEIYGALQGQASELAGDARELNARTFKQVAAIIPPAEARRLRNAFYRGEYSSLAGLVSKSENAWMTNLLRLDRLTGDQRAVLEAASADYERRIEHLIAEGVDKADTFWKGFSPFEMNPDRNNAFREAVEALNEEAEQAENAAVESIELQIGADVVTELRGALAEMDAAKAAVPVMAGGEATGEPADPTEAIAYDRDRFLPDRISRRDVRRYARQLQLDASMNDVLDELHADYLHGIASMGELVRLRQARNAMRAEDGEAAETPVAVRVELVVSRRREAIAAMVAADDAFFDNVAAIIDPAKKPLVDRVRSSRQREAWAGQASDRFSLGSNISNEAGVDLVSIVLETQPPADELDHIDGLLTDYERQATEAFRARLDAQLEMQRRGDVWRAEIETASQEDLAAVIELQNRYREEMREPTTRVARTNERIAKLNRGTLESLLGALTPERAHTVRTAYDKAAFASVFTDAACIDAHLANAKQLDDLTADQRERLLELDASYRADYQELSRDMIEHVEVSAVNVVGLEAEAFRKWQERQQQFAKIAFDRNELNGRAISRLHAILTPEQVLRIGGLPEPLGEDEFFLYR